jgi:hypothetical protein
MWLVKRLETLRIPSSFQSLVVSFFLIACLSEFFFSSVLIYLLFRVDYSVGFVVPVFPIIVFTICFSF